MSDDIIIARDLTRRFGSFTAVDKVNFRVGRGEIFGYLGANGAGKSTTIRMLCGLLRRTEGEAIVVGTSVADDPRAVKRSIGYMSQKFSLYLDLTVEENLRFFAGAYGLRGNKLKTQLAAALERSGLSDRRTMLTRALPGGIRQRLALASALLHEPRLIFLDEPTAGVSPDSRRDFWRTIRQLAHQGTTVFVTTHYLDEAEYCERVGLMTDGKLVALDTPAELKRRFAPGRMVALPGLALNKELRNGLRKSDGVLDVQPFGRSLHVRTKPELDDAWLSSFLRSHGVASTEIEPIDASLEDVFLALAGKAEAADQAAGGAS